MYIILKSYFNEKNEILNIFYGDDENLIRNWINEYINKDIESLKQCPLDKDIRSLSYEIDQDKDITRLIKHTKRVNRGYVYNSSEKFSEVVYTLTCLEHTATNNGQDATLQSNEKWSDINKEINNRVLKQLDKESLYQILIEIQNAIKTKSNWNYTEYTSLVSETIRSFKKELYSSIAKRLKRFGKKQSSYVKNIKTHSLDKETINILNSAVKTWSGSSCHLESKDKIE